MAEFQKFYGPITLIGHESREWASINAADIATKGEITTYVAGVQTDIEGQISAARGGAVAAGETKDVTGGVVYSYLSDNSTVAGGSGKNGKFLKLDANGLIDTSALPPLAISSITVGTTAPSSGVQEGDVFVNTDENKSYIYTGSGNWQELLTPTDTVLSVNGETGVVVLDAADVGAIDADALVTTVSSASTDATVPSALAVYSFVNTGYSPVGHTHVSADVTDSISAGTDITSSATGLVQGKAVAAYVASEISALSLASTYVAKADGITAGTGITSSATGWTSGKAVSEFVASEISGLDLANTYVAIDDGIGAGTGITASADGWTQGKAVYEFVNSAISALNLATTYAPISHTHTAADLPTATNSALGVASFDGDSFTVTSGAVSLKAATASTFGGVKVTAGNGLGLADGVVSMGLANGTTAGAAKQGTGVTVTDGAISVNFSTDVATDATSDVKAATPKAVKTYVDGQLGSASAIGTITGTGSATKFEIAHTLGAAVVVTVVDGDGNVVWVPTKLASNKVTVEFATAPANNAVFNVYISKVGGTHIAATVVTA